MNSILENRIDAPENEDKQDYREFPIEVFPTTVSRYIREASAEIVCPPELVGVPLLAMFASAIGGSRVVQVRKNWTEGPSLYAATIARPGDKKTPAANQAVRPATKMQGELRRRYQRERKQYESDASDASDTDSRVEPTMERTLVEDTTTEALAKVLNDNLKRLV